VSTGRRKEVQFQGLTIILPAMSPSPLSFEQQQLKRIERRKKQRQDLEVMQNSLMTEFQRRR